MNDDNDITPLIVLLAVAFVVTISVAQGYSMGESSARRETISYCVEQPTACKTKYDYYKLENQK
ncbi:hypothetical protein SCREM1_99 [Synechococcus phage S-CREM1]|nr:hypothetical protein SCREM1_99 [Synechococcus phage S-CREM1]